MYIFVMNALSFVRDIINEEFADLHDDHNELFGQVALPKPKEIAAALSEYVIGQEDAKRLAVAVYNHYKRIGAFKKSKYILDDEDDVEIQKSNIIMIRQLAQARHCLRRLWLRFSMFLLQLQMPLH